MASTGVTRLGKRRLLSDVSQTNPTRRRISGGPELRLFARSERPSRAFYRYEVPHTDALHFSTSFGSFCMDIANRKVSAESARARACRKCHQRDTSPACMLSQSSRTVSQVTETWSEVVAHHRVKPP